MSCVLTAAGNADRKEDRYTQTMDLTLVIALVTE
jgi:hypothetical protein